MTDTKQAGSLMVWLRENYTPAGRILVVSILLASVAATVYVFYSYFFLLPPGRYSITSLLVLFVSPIALGALILFILGSIVLHKLGYQVHRDNEEH